MQFNVLGPLSIIAHGGTERRVEGRIPQAILCYLLIHRNEVVPAERLVMEIWGEDAPSSGVKNLQAHVSKLRDMLEPNRPRGSDGTVVLSRDSGYSVAADGDTLDAAAFEALVAHAQQITTDDPVRASRLLVDAEALWRGSPFLPVEQYSFARSEADRLNEVRLVGLETRLGIAIDLGNHDDAVPDLERLTYDYPLRERFWVLLMLALYRSGRQADALRAFRRCSEILRDELGIDPSHDLQDMEERVLMQDPSLATPKPALDSLPTVPAVSTRLIGRATQLDEVSRLLESSRHVTVIGVGGVGKTGLANELAGRHDDVVWLELGPLNDPDMIVRALATAIGEARSATAEKIASRLFERHALVVFDNCEHLIDGAADVIGTLLNRAPSIRVLATSREALNTPGESTYLLDPLAIPEAAAEEEQIVSADAVLLFVERAQAADQRFDPIDQWRAIGSICRRVDGVALAVELAAARVRALSVREIDDQLRESAIRIGGRSRTGLEHQQTLESTIQWSFDLLRPEEQRGFVALGTFAGAFGLKAGTRVLDALPDLDPVDILVSLVDKSMLSAVVGDTVEYRLTGPIRDFARRRLAASSDRQTVEAAYGDWAAEFAQRASARLFSSDRFIWNQRIQRSAGDFRRVLEQSVDSDPSRGVRLLSSLETFLLEAGDHEGFLTSAAVVDEASWIERLEAAGDSDAALLAPVLSVRGVLLMMQGHDDSASAVLERALSLYEQMGDPVGIGRTQMYLACAIWER